MFFNLLYKALKADSDVSRVAAFVKRLLQLALNSPPEFICGVLLIISETMRVHPELVAMITNTVDTQEESVGDQKDGDDTAAVYDPLKQSPRLALAESSCLWELSTLVEHYHPTVVIFAQTLLKQEHIEGEADPLNDYTNSRFLEKFVFKNPKKIKALPQDRAHMAKFIRPQRDASLETRVTSKQFLAQDVADVAADERFFHQYFTARAISRDNVSDSRKLKRKRKHMDIEEYADSIMDEELDRLGGMEDQFEMEWTDSDEEAKTGSAFADKEDSSDGEWVEFDPEAVAREKAGVAALIANEFKGMELPAAFADVADAEVDLDDISMSEDSSDDEEDVLPEGAYGSESDSDIGSLFAGDDTDDSSGSESSDIDSDVDDADLEKAKSAKRKVFASGAEFTKILERSAESSVDKYTAARASDNGKQGGKQRKFKKRRKN
jgi:ribosome biogenesis protein MAK21